MREAAYEIARQSDAFAPSIAHEFIEALAKPITQLIEAWKLARFHRSLEQLDDRQLADIGVARSEIHRLTGKSGPVNSPARTLGEVRCAGWQCTAR